MLSWANENTETLQERIAALMTQNIKLQRERDEAQAKCAEMRPYLWHKKECKFLSSFFGECNCGLLYISVTDCGKSILEKAERLKGLLLEAVESIAPLAHTNGNHTSTECSACGFMERAKQALEESK